MGRCPRRYRDQGAEQSRPHHGVADVSQWAGGGAGFFAGGDDGSEAAPAPLIERLCKNLAFHLIESEITLSLAEGAIEDWRDACNEARDLIKEAGFDIDALYP